MVFIKSFFKGICLGAGAILPGISSGVLCVIFGIYDKLIESILGIFNNFKKNFLFLLPIILGSLIGVLLLGKLLSFLFTNYPMPMQYAFIGLILGSVPILFKKINTEKTFKLHYLLYTVIAFIAGLLMVVLEEHISTNVINTNSDLLNVLSTNALPSISSIMLLIVSGFFMSIGIVVPGVSSTAILMCFGIYPIYLQAISSMNLLILLPLAIGVILGGIVFLKIIKYLLDNYYIQTFYLIIGFTIGSVLVLYSPLSFNFAGAISVVLLIVCFHIASFFEKVA